MILAVLLIVTDSKVKLMLALRLTFLSDACNDLKLFDASSVFDEKQSPALQNFRLKKEDVPGPGPRCPRPDGREREPHELFVQELKRWHAGRKTKLKQGTERFSQLFSYATRTLTYIYV